MGERLLLRVEEVAEMLSLGRSKTYELIASGAIPVVHLGRCVRVPAPALRRWVESQCDGETLAAGKERNTSGGTGE